MDRVSFLRKQLSSKHSSQVTDTILAAFRPSSVRQQEVAWRHFKQWLPATALDITIETVLNFLHHLFSSSSLSPTTINNYKNSLAWPLNLGFGIDFQHKEISLFIKGLFHKRPHKSTLTPSWDLGAVLTALQCINTTDLKQVFFKALILTALASGNRVSEIAALDRKGIIFGNNRITIPVHPQFIFKNQTMERQPPAVSFPGLPSDNLCPISAINLYIERTSGSSHQNRLFVNPVSGKPLTANRLSYWIVQAIRAIDPTIKVRAHDFRKWAFSVNWARRKQVTEILQAGFWSSSHPFLNNYLTQIDSPLPQFVAAGTTEER